MDDAAGIHTDRGRAYTGGREPFDDPGTDENKGDHGDCAHDGPRDQEREELSPGQEAYDLAHDCKSWIRRSQWGAQGLDPSTARDRSHPSTRGILNVSSGPKGEHERLCRVEIRTVKNSCSRPVPSASGAPGDQAGRRLLAQGARIDSCVEC